MSTLTFALKTEKATAQLAKALYAFAPPVGVIALYGTLGAGKTTFSRFFLQAAGWQESVPSPTYTLAQPYLIKDRQFWHFDFYRLENPHDAYELDIPAVFSQGLCLLEWPEKINSLLPTTRLDMVLHIDENNNRHAQLSGHGLWQEYLCKFPQ